MTLAGSPTTLRIGRRSAWIGIPAVLLVLLAAFWQWDWFIPIVQSQASAAIGRPVAISHLHVRLGRIIQITADDVVIANPSAWPKDDPPLASIGSLTVQANIWDYIRGRGLVLPLVAFNKLRVYAIESPDDSSNFRLPVSSSAGGSSPAIGDLRIDDGDARVVIPSVKADFRTKIATQDEGDAAKLIVDAHGSYAAQPITARLVGGALLSLRDAAHPWPVDLTMANGPTRVALKGTLDDPLALKGANVTLKLSGPDMGLLEHLVGFRIPRRLPIKSPVGRISRGSRNSALRIPGPAGTPIAGTITSSKRDRKERQDRAVVTMDLRSDRVDLADLNGSTGASEAAQTLLMRRRRTGSGAGQCQPQLLPDTPSARRAQPADIHCAIAARISRGSASRWTIWTWHWTSSAG